MAYNHLFIDSDILLDMLLNRNPFFTQILFVEAEKRGLNLSTSALVIANIYYVLAEALGSALAKKQIEKLVTVLNVLPIDAETINSALKSKFNDFEDSIQHFVAKTHFCEALITRNIKDYKHSEIPVLTTEQFLKTL